MHQLRKSALPFLLIFSLSIHPISAANDTIGTSQSITDGQTLISSDGMFALGFFSPGNSSKRYLGIWYNNLTVHTVVWVANSQAPLTQTSGVLTLRQSGILSLLDDANGTIVWSSNATSASVRNPSAELLDSGNLVVKDGDDDSPENRIWQSFDYPSDSYLPGTSIGWNYLTGVETYYTSWRSEDDPAPGEFSCHLDPTGYPQIVVRRLDVIQTRSGPWNGVRFGGAPGTRNGPILRMNRNEVRYGEDTLPTNLNPDGITLLKLLPDGVGQRWIWSYQTNSWTKYTTSPADRCDSYGLCGANGVCSIGNSPNCGCLDRFVPRDGESWGRTDWSRGCVRRTPLNCSSDVFFKYPGIKLPDSRYSWFDDRRISLAECEVECSRNCSCVAYTQLDIRDDSGGCLFYHGDLIDIRTMVEGGQDLYIRMASGELESKGRRRLILIASVTSATVFVLMFLIFIVFYYLKRKKDQNLRKQGSIGGDRGKEAELPFFNLSTILKATNNFSFTNKIGQGGFGSVYRGKLEDGQEIAVKRLSNTSSQGVEELKNEVILIAKLQHRNTVRLLGCCVEGEENMLIYEYMPNNSLDRMLFGQTRFSLDWGKRFEIITGTAKGLLYLHQDSRLRIIHRDLKASNVLLDAEMNPKISDFGLARGFGGNETEAQTRRVVGTYGYMSPEYAVDGLFSIKSDVFSFGVLVLEVVSGKRNRKFTVNDQNRNLLGHAWTLYKENKSCELVDASLGDSFDSSQALRSIHVGLLCVQDCPDDRPSMSSVVFMLGNEVELPEAKQPGFFTECDVSVSETASSENVASSVNQVTITMPEGR